MPFAAPIGAAATAAFALLGSALAVGLLASDVSGDYNARFGRGKVDGTAVNAYARAKLSDKANLVGRVGYGTYTFNTSRETTDVVRATGRTDADSFTSSIGVNYGHKAHGFTVVPRADLTYSHGNVDAFTETGATDRLTLSDYGSNRFVAQLGAALLFSRKFGGHAFSFELNGGLDHNLSDSKDTQTATPVIAPGAAFTQTFAKDDQTRVNYGARVGYAVSESTAVFGSYEGRSSTNNSDTVNAGLRMTF